jgi:MFS family permease
VSQVKPQPTRVAGVSQGVTVVIAAFLPILAIISMFPAVPAMIQHFSADPAARIKVPSMVTAPGLTIAIVALFMGMLVDRFGRRRLLLVSTFCYGFFGALPFLLESLNAVYASRLLLGVSEAAILTTLNTLIADYWDDKGRRNWLTVQGLAGPALSSVVIYFAGTLVNWRWNAIFLMYLIGLPIFVAMWAWLYEPSGETRPSHAAGLQTGGKDFSNFPWRVVSGIGALTLFSSALYYVFIINGGIVWQELGVKDPEQIGRMTALPSLFILAGAVVFWLQGRFGISARGQIFTFLVLLGVGLARIGLATDSKGMILGMAMQQTGAGMAVPVLIAWAQKQLPFEHRGRGMGVWAACFFFGQFSSPLLVSAMRGSTGTMQGAFLASGVIGIVGAVVLWQLLSQTVAGRAASA